MAKSVFNIASSVVNTIKGYQAMPFIPIMQKSHHGAEPFDEGDYSEKKADSITGVALRKYEGSIYYFMPVTLTGAGGSFEFTDVMVSVSGEKTIVKTPLVGRQGTVKELISIEDYEINLLAIVSGDDYPEADLQSIVSIFEINQSIEIKSAITNYFLKAEDKVVVKHISMPPLEGVEDMQVVVMKLESDQNFELEIG